MNTVFISKRFYSFTRSAVIVAKLIRNAGRYACRFDSYFLYYEQAFRAVQKYCVRLLFCLVEICLMS